jgi:hypothetical protein
MVSIDESCNKARLVPLFCKRYIIWKKCFLILENICIFWNKVRKSQHVTRKNIDIVMCNSYKTILWNSLLSWKVMFLETNAIAMLFYRKNIVYDWYCFQEINFFYVNEYTHIWVFNRVDYFATMFKCVMYIINS